MMKAHNQSFQQTKPHATSLAGADTGATQGARCSFEDQEGGPGGVSGVLDAFRSGQISPETPRYLAPLLFYT